MADTPADPLHKDALRHCPHLATGPTPVDSHYEVTRQARTAGDARIMFRAALLEWLSVNEVKVWYQLPKVVRGDDGAWYMQFAAEVVT